MMATPIIALDVQHMDLALDLVRRLGDRAGFYKVGSELFTAAGPPVVRSLRGMGKQVFLDLKFHDIPNTVRAACRSASELGASLVTVHASGGARMIAAAVEGAGPECGVLAVTVLTSATAEEYSAATGKVVSDLSAEVSRLAAVARGSGAHGVVCSGHEARRLRDEHGTGLALLVPGIRLPGGEAHDQARVMTPCAAAEAGATYLVIGRAVTAAPDPVQAMEQVVAELGGG